MSRTVQGLQADFNQTANAPSPQEVTAYFRAATTGDLAGVQAFVGAYPNSVDVTDFSSMAHVRGLSTGLSALQLAALNDRVAVLNYLIDNGANIEQSNNSKWTPLIHAAASGHVGATAALLAKGASKSAKTSNGWNAERAAKENGHHPDSKAVIKLISTPTRKEKILSLAIDK